MKKEDQKIKKVWYYETEYEKHNEPHITTNFNDAIDKREVRLATLEDLEYNVAAYGQQGILDGVLKCDDGNYSWQSHLEENFMGVKEECEGYKLVKSYKRRDDSDY